jgi:spore cortex biosynthesis protein YabQ
LLGISVSQQTIAFLTACIFGMALGAIYDVFRIFRIAITCGKIVVFIQDIIFFVLSATLSFLLMLYTNTGEIRLFYILGELIGFCIYYFTIGILVYKSAKAVVEFIKKILRVVFRLILKPIWRLIIIIIGFTKKISIIVINIIKNNAKVYKTHLQVDKSIVYNLIGNKINKNIRKKKTRRRRKSEKASSKYNT